MGVFFCFCEILRSGTWELFVPLQPRKLYIVCGVYLLPLPPTTLVVTKVTRQTTSTSTPPIGNKGTAQTYNNKPKFKQSKHQFKIQD